MRKMIEACPTCGSNLTITEVQCDTCGTQVRSRYSPCPFCALVEDQQTFLLLFVRNRGNLKELEKILGISYPTVRAKLDELIEQLAPPAPTVTPTTGQRSAVLAQVQAGRLSAAEALALLGSQPAGTPPRDESTGKD
ncbi:MAG: DUF2089 domain-containing protein [Anaerolineae bacterium]